MSDMESEEIVNPVVYFEIAVIDMTRAVAFYTAVFGFTFEMTSIDGNEMALFPYNESGGGVSGALALGESYKPSTEGTLVYFNSSDIDATLAKVEEQGGSVFYPTTAIGELGFVAEFIDSEGNRVGLHAR